MIYANYVFYKDDFLLGRKPIIAENDFNFYANKASRLIDKATYGKAEIAYNEPTSETSIRETLGCCCCELAEMYYKRDNEKQDIVSEKVGEFSVSYNHQADIDFNKLINFVIRTHLANTGLLYCGVT